MATVAGALTGTVGLCVIHVGAPRDALAADPRTVLELVAHNAPVALWPLALVALGWPQLRVAPRAGDALVAGQLLGHGLLVGTALAQQPGLWRYLPHLPLEWLAIAVPAGAWLTARAHPPTPPQHRVAALALMTVVVVALAALVETYLVPIP